VISQEEDLAAYLDNVLMQQTLLILPILVPVTFWAVYHYHKDRHLPEPLLNLAVCFILGLGSAGLSKLMYLGLEPLGLRYDAVALAAENRLGLLAFALLAIGPIEELAKMLPFVLIALRFKVFDEPLDGIIYASFIALGYAAAENVYYAEFLTPLEVAARGFASPVVHMLFASIWAHWITQAWLTGKSNDRRNLGVATVFDAPLAPRSSSQEQRPIPASLGKRFSHGYRDSSYQTRCYWALQESNRQFQIRGHLVSQSTVSESPKVLE